MKAIKLILIALVLGLAVQAVAADFVVITHPGNSASSISQQDLKNIYLGKKSRWDDGSSIVVMAQKSGALTDAFISEAVGKTTQQYFIYWRKIVFTGKGTPPVEMDTDAQAKAAVASRPGAIGYIAASALDGSVKQLKVR